MDVDTAPIFFTNGTELEMNKLSMSPMTPTFESVLQLRGEGFDFMPWATADCNYSHLDYSPNESLGSPDDGGSYDYFSIPIPPAEANLSYQTPESTYMDWSSTTHSAPPTASPVTEFSFFGAEGNVADTDSDSWTHSPLPVSPADAATKRTHTESTRPSKRACSQANPTATSSKSRDKASLTSSKSKPKSDSKAKSTSKCKHNKPTEEADASMSVSSGYGGNHKIQLRTASRKAKPRNTASKASALPSPVEEGEDDLLTPEERRARQSHNLVEKQYRNRLNMQFESLLAVLPADKNGTDDRHRMKGSAGGAGEGDDRRLSKAEVLDMARQRIMTLELEHKTLRKEKKELLDNVSVMRDALARQRMGKRTMASC